MNQTKSTSKKLLALLLALIMTVSLLPMSVFAAELATDESAQGTEAVMPGDQQDAEDAALTEEETEDAEPADGEGDVTLPEEPAEDAEPEEDVTLPGDEGDAELADPYAADGIAVQAATDSEFQYKILHLDCGRKYFTKNWIIALLNEMSAAGYNQLQLAFGNKGLRFLLDDMSVTVDGKTCDSDTVTEAIQAGNDAYDTSKNYKPGDKEELTQAEMDAILAKAEELEIDIVPLFNTPFHMEAVITAMESSTLLNRIVHYQETVNGEVKDHTACLDLSDDAAKEFVTALMKKYVDYFAGKNCKFFNFGADEYKGSWNDTFYNYANSIATMISTAGMTARVFNDSFRSDSSNKINNVQVCYWTSGSDYATTQDVRRSAEVINTNQDFYYVVNKDETVQSNWSPDAYYTFVGTYGDDWIEKALTFSNTTYKNHGYTNNGASSVTPIGSMFCVWSDNPGDKDQTQIAKEIRMILRVMAARMAGKDDYADSSVIVTNGFNADGTINGGTTGGETGGDTEPGTTVDINVAVGDTVTKTVDGRYPGVLLDNEYATVSGVVSSTGGGTTYNPASPAVGEFYVSSKSNDTAPTAQLTLENAGSGKYYIKVDGSYVYPDWSNKQAVLTSGKQAVTVTDNGDSVTISRRSGNNTIYLALNNAGSFTATRNSTSATLYLYTKGTTNPTYETELTFTGVKPGETSYKIGDVTYNITVEAKTKTVNVTLEVGDSTTFNVGNSKISKSPDSNIATAAWSDGVLTLVGVAVGKTECVVGDTKYVITVVEEGSGTNTPLYVDLWVTNHGVLPDTAKYKVVNGEAPTDPNNPARRVTLQYEADKFASPEGLSVSEFLPSTGKDTANETRVAAYWKTRYLPQSTRQTMDGWTNKSGYGTDVLSGKAGGLDIERVRYYAGTWAYLPVGGTDWVDFTTAEENNANAVTKDESGAQIVAFYMLKTTVTKEVTTYVTDWSDTVDYAKNPIFGVALDYCVKFEGDTSKRYPDTFGKTATPQSQWFNCQYAANETAAKDNGYTLFAAEVGDSSWKGNGSSKYYRVINNIQAVETDQYEVYMITTLATEGNLSTATDVDNQNYDMPPSITYPDEYSKEKVIWAIDEKTATDSGLEKHDEYKQGGTPDVSRVVIQRGTGMLLTYYVRAKATTESKVTVEYYENSSNVKFYGFDIPTGKGTPNTFEQFQWNVSNGSKNPWIGDHYICNRGGDQITINSDLALVPGLAAKYKAGGFTLTKIERSEDNKTLRLYYDFTDSFTYVVDFGVPAKIERKSEEKVLKVTCGDKVLFDAEPSTAKDVVERSNGKLYMTAADSIYYELTTMQYSGTPDTFTLMFTYQNDDGTESEKAFNVTVIPASNVYYEDTNSFMTFENGQGVAGNAKWTEVLDTDEPAINSKQIAEIVGEAKNVYGYDPTYNNCTMFSLGRAHKVTVSAADNWNENSDAWPTAQFTFKGTGFDVISLTNDDSGLLTYKIEKLEDNGSWTTKTQQFVINYYDYGYDANTKTWTKEAPQTLYQLPVIKADGLSYGTYRVTLTVAYGAIFDKTNDGDDAYSIWLDGVRIYDPAGPDLNQTYAKDGEGWAQYIELRDQLAEQKEQRTALFIEDASNSTSIEDYKNYGPNHEVYLLNNQAIAFQLDSIGNVDKVQIGAKAPMGSATLTVNGGTTTVLESLETATEMYYDITDAAKSGKPVIITNGSTEDSSILSLTQLKITYEKDPSKNGGEAKLSILSAEQQEEVVQMVHAMYAPAPEPDPEPFAPERFEASWNRSTVKVGQKATLTVKTSEDVEAITVDGVTIDTYRTRTQRTGWGWNAKRVTYREFTYTITANEAGTLNCSIAALNAENTASEPITAALTVQAAAQRPSWGGWLGNLFGRWF